MKLDISALTGLVKQFGDFADGIEEYFQAADAAAAQSIANLARLRVPKDTGKLLGSIEARREDGNWMVAAGEDDAYYGRFVEYGTAPGAKGQRRTGAEWSSPPVADGAYFERDAWEESRGIRPGAKARRGRKVLRTHPGTAPHPFFWPSVNDVLGPRRIEKAQDRVRDLATKAGFDVTGNPVKKD